MSDINLRIHEAAYRLAAEGVWPTVNSVRERVGSGSNTTINSELKNWRQQFLAKLSTASRRPDWPPVLIEAVEKIWQTACEQAEQHLETVKTEVEAERLAWQTEKEAFEAERLALLAIQDNLQAEQLQQQQALHLLQEHLQQAIREKEIAQASHITLEKANAALLQDFSRQQVQFDEKMAQLQLIHQERIQQIQLEAERKEELAYARLEGLRIQLYQQAEDERQRLNKEKQQIQDNLQAQQKQFSLKEERYQEQLQHLQNHLLQAQWQTQQQQAQLQEKQQQLEQVRLNHEQIVLAWRETTQALGTLRQEYENLRQQLIENAEKKTADNESPRETS